MRIFQRSVPYGSFRKFGVPYFGALIYNEDPSIRVPYFRKLPYVLGLKSQQKRVRHAMGPLLQSDMEHETVLATT